MNHTNEHISAALHDPELTHSAFRLYCVLVERLGDRSQGRPVNLSVGKLRAAVPGVKGKPFGEGPLREAVRILQEAGLIEVFGPQWSKISIGVKLADPPRPGKPPEDFVLPGQI